MMLKKVMFAAAIAALTTATFAATLLEENFTQAQLGQRPASLAASFDADTDTVVINAATANPVVTERTGGDGYYLRVGDIGASGGAFNWAYPASMATQSDAKVSAYVYVSWAGQDATPKERNYLLAIRMQVANPQTGTYVRQGYMMAISNNSSWPGITPNPSNGKPYLLKRVQLVHTMIGSEAAAAVSEGWHLLTLEAVGTTIKGYVDGVEVCSGTDTSYASGFAAIGYYEKNGEALTWPYAATYDNLKYESIVPASVNEWSIYE
jgi:hypothetical protein